MLDLAWFQMGCPAPATVSGQVYNKYPVLTQTDDSAFALIRFADERSLQVEASWVLAQEADQKGVHLYGTAGGARVDDDSLDLYTVNEQSRIRISFSLLGGQPAFTAQATNFVRAVRGAELMAMLETIYRSGVAGREIRLSE